MEVDDVRASLRLVRAIKVDDLIVLIDTRTKGHLKLNYGRFDVAQASFNDSNGIVIAGEEDCVYSVIAHKLCFDIFGVPVLVIVYIASHDSLNTCNLSAAHVYLAENRLENLVIQSQISKPVFVQASISIDSQIFVLNRKARCLYYLASFGTPSLKPESVTLEKGFGDVSLVSLDGDFSESPIQLLELPVLLYISSSNGSPIKSLDTEINASHGKLDLWGLSSVLDMFNSSKILKNIQEELEANYRTGSSTAAAETGQFSCFASLRASRGRLEVVSCPQMDRWLYNLPNEPITQIYGIGGGKPLLFATSTSLASMASACSPQLCCSLSSPLCEFLLLNSAEDTDAVVALLENGSIIYFDLLRGLDLVTTSTGTCSSILPIDISSDTECEGILLFQPRSEPKFSKIEWYEHESLGIWSSMTLNQLKKINNSVHLANQGTNLGDSIANGMKTGNGFSATSSVSTGAESLVNALKGRLEVSRLNLEEIQQRLEAKEKILARALNLISSLSTSSPQPLVSQNNDTIPFVLDHDLSPIVGVDSVPKDERPQKSSFSSPLPKHLVVDAVQYALVDGKYVFQLTIRNTDPKNDLVIQNALVSDSENEISVFLVQCLSISSGKIGIISATVTMLGESFLSPSVTVTFLLEAVWQKKDVATSTPLLVPITAVVLSPCAFSSPQIAFPVFPYTTSILVKSKRLLLSGQVVSQLLKPKFQEIGGITENKTGSGVLLNEEGHSPDRTFIASSTASIANSEASIPLMVKTRCEENVLCVDIGALDEDQLLRFVQYFQSSLHNDLHRSSEETIGERRKNWNEAAEGSTELFENPLSAAVLSRLTTALTALKKEIQHIISFPQMISENGVNSTASDVWRWKKSFLTLQAASDVALSNI